MIIIACFWHFLSGFGLTFTPGLTRCVAGNYGLGFEEFEEHALRAFEVFALRAFGEFKFFKSFEDAIAIGIALRVFEEFFRKKSYYYGIQVLIFNYQLSIIICPLPVLLTPYSLLRSPVPSFSRHASHFYSSETIISIGFFAVTVDKFLSFFAILN